MGPSSGRSPGSWLTEAARRHRAPSAYRAAPAPLAEVELHLPFEVGDYVDFYASEHHASNVGRIFRPDQEPLLPNWKHLPVGYHGRAGTVVASGTDIVRPCGQRKAPDGRRARPSARAAARHRGRARLRRRRAALLGEPVAHRRLRRPRLRRGRAQRLVRPRHPGLGVRPARPVPRQVVRHLDQPWVTPLAALDAAWTDLPGQDPEPLDYLRVDGPAGLDIDVEVVLNGEVVARPPYASMYWSPPRCSPT